MSVGKLLTALSLQDYNDNDVPLLSLPTRRVTSASGLLGIASREVVVARTGHGGSRNLTRYREDAQIVINGILSGSSADDTWAQLDAVNQAFAASVDTDRLLKWTAGTTQLWQRNVRLTSIDEPLTIGPDIISYQVTFRGSDATVYSQALQTSNAVPLGASGGGGWTIPFTFPKTLNPPATTTAAFTNGGFVPTPPIFTLNGYLQNPTILSSTGDGLYLTGEISSTDTLVIDVDQRTIMLNGISNRLSMLDPTSSTWFNLPPGSGTITLQAANFTPGAGLQISWRDARA